MQTVRSVGLTGYQNRTGVSVFCPLFFHCPPFGGWLLTAKNTRTHTHTHTLKQKRTQTYRDTRKKHGINRGTHRTNRSHGTKESNWRCRFALPGLHVARAHSSRPAAVRGVRVFFLVLFRLLSATIVALPGRCRRVGSRLVSRAKEAACERG